jgi:predicted RNase H-like nuclease (RuvC/YqgF family)
MRNRGEIQLTQDEATELVDYYEEHRQERAKMKQEIGIEHPASHYIEALERYIEHLEDEYAPSQDACTISDIRNASVGTNMQPLLIPETWDKLLMESALQHHAARYTKNSQ